MPNHIISQEDKPVKASYPWDKCIADMTNKYGADSAPKICGMIRSKYGSKSTAVKDAPAGSTAEADILLPDEFDIEAALGDIEKELDIQPSVDLDGWTDKVRTAFSELYPNSPYQLTDVWCDRVWDDHVRARVGDKLYNVPYQMNDDEVLFAPASEWVEVELVETPIKLAADTLIAYGGEIKALGDGKVGGYLVRFSTENDPDLEGEYFTKDTDFGELERLPVLYHHGLDAKVGRRRIGKGTVKPDGIGLWIEAQLNLRDEYEKAIYGFVEQKKMGWSSGAVAHATERVPMAKAVHITQWFIAEGSVTPTPAEHRNVVIPIKSLKSTTLELPEATPQAHLRGDAATAANIKTTDSAAHRATNTRTATNEVNEMTLEEKQALLAEIQKAATDATKLAIADGIKSINDRLESLKAEPPTTLPAGVKTMNAPNIVTHPLGQPDGLKAYRPEVLAQYAGTDEVKSLLYYLRTGDKSGMKASNAVAMQEDTNAEGGYTVPVGLYQGIIARRNEVSLRSRLGLRNIPGKGKTVDVPYDNEADGEFVSTSEESAMDADSPDLQQAAMTLVKYTKKITISWELLNDEDVNLLAFLADWVGRGMGKTENSLILTEVAADGTALKTFASATAIAAGEPEDIIYNSNVSYYLDDGGSVGWVMRPSTYASLAKLTGNFRLYAEQVQGSKENTLAPTLLGYPVFFSEKAAAIAASAKDVYFGNWYYVGYRESPALTFLRDEYSRADNGQVVLRYYFRQVYKQLQAAAVGYGQHPSA